MKSVAFGLAAALVMGLANASLANEMIAAKQLSGTTVGFVLKGSYTNATLSVSGPDGFHAQVFSKGGAVAVNLSEHGAVVDGQYSFQLTAASGVAMRAGSAAADGRASTGRALSQKPGEASGSFSVRGGKIINGDAAGLTETGRRDQDSR